MTPKHIKIPCAVNPNADCLEVYRDEDDGSVWFRASTHDTLIGINVVETSKLVSLVKFLEQHALHDVCGSCGRILPRKVKT